jgi:hypothetical protein
MKLNKMEKELYKLRVKDFVPVFGMARHQKRCQDSPLFSDKNFKINFYARDALLVVYNLSIPFSLYMGESKLLELLK